MILMEIFLNNTLQIFKKSQSGFRTLSFVSDKSENITMVLNPLNVCYFLLAVHLCLLGS